MNWVIDRAHDDLMALQNGGVDAVMFSQQFSLPYLTKVRPGNDRRDGLGNHRSVNGEIRVPFGVNVLWDPVASLIWRWRPTQNLSRNFLALTPAILASGIRMSAKPFAISIASARARVNVVLTSCPEAAVYLGNRDVCSIAEIGVFNNNPMPCASRG